MRLQGQVSRVYKGKKYEKRWIVVPNTLLDKLGWKEGDNLKAETKGGKLVVERE